MNLEVREIGGCESASLSLEPGKVEVMKLPNAAGKTSILRSLGVLLSRDTNPLRLQGTQIERRYCRNGNVEDAEAKLLGDGWSLRWKPGNKVEEGGDAPSPVDAEVLTPVFIGSKGQVAAAEWQRLLRAKVPPDELRSRLDKSLAGFKERKGIIDEMVHHVYETPERWEGALAIAQDRAREWKARWRDVVAEAGESKTWGKVAGAKWRPKSWSSHCEGLTSTTAVERVATLEQEVNKAQATKFASVEDVEKLPGLRDRSVELSERVKECTESAMREQRLLSNRQNAYDKQQEAWGEWKRVNAELEKWQTEHEQRVERRKLWREKARAEREAVKGKSENRWPCPCCEAILSFDGEKLVVANGSDGLLKADETYRETVAREGESAARLKEAQEAQAAALKAFGGTKPEMPHSNMLSTQKLDRLKGQAKEAETELKFVDGEIERIEGLSKDEPTADAAKLQDRLAEAASVAQALDWHSRALDAHEQTCRWEAVVADLKPTGIRSDYAKDRTAKFNDLLKGLKASAEWRGDISLDPANWRLTLDGQGLEHLSSSEKWRVAAAVSVSLSVWRKSPVVLFDDAEMLVGEKQPGDTFEGFLAALRKLCGKLKIPALVAVAGFEGGKA